MAIRVMLLVLAAVPSAAAEQNGDVCVETGAHQCETKPLYLIQTKTELFHRDTPAQPVQPATPGGNTVPAAAQPATAVVDAAGLSVLFSDTSNICAAVMIGILSVSLGVLIWTQRDRFKNSSTTEKIATSCVVLYVVLTMSVHVLIRRFHQQGVNTAFQFSPAVVTLLIEVGKLSVMVVGALVDWENTRKCTLAEFMKTMKLMSIPAGCFVTMNILRFTCLSGTDLDQYRVWRSTDTIFVACIWFAVFKKTPGVNQIAGIGLVLLSGVIVAMTHPLTRQQAGQVAPIMAMVLLSSVGLVLNEFGLKASTELSLFVQNMTLYFLTTVLNSAVVLATVPTGQIFQGINSPQIALVGIDVVTGVCIACVLKYADAIVKQLANGWLAPLEPLVGHFFVSTPVTPTMVFATMLAGAGTIVYRLPEQTSKKEDAAAEQKTEKSAAERMLPATEKSAAEQKEQN